MKVNSYLTPVDKLILTLKSIHMIMVHVVFEYLSLSLQGLHPHSYLEIGLGPHELLLEVGYLLVVIDLEGSS